MGGHAEQVCSRVGGRGRHWALRCHGVAVRARRQVWAMRDLPQRTLALRTTPQCHPLRLPAHVRRPYARSKDAAVKCTATQSPHARSKTLWPLAALAVALISAGCSNAAAETATGSGGGNTNAANRDQAVKFANCMRANGVREFPDPDASGTLPIDGVANGSSLDTSSA